MNISVRVQAYVDSSHAGEQDESFPNVIFCSHSTVTMKNITKKNITEVRSTNRDTAVLFKP